MKKTIEELEKEVEQIKADLEELKLGQTEWKPEEDELYYFVDLDWMTVDSDYWEEEEEDEGGNSRLNHKVVFKTREEAEEYLQYLIAKEKAMNEFSKEEWEDEELNKNYIFFDCKSKKFCISNNQYFREYNKLYFRTKEQAQEFINKYKKQIKRDMGIC